MLAAVLFVPRASADFISLNSSDPTYSGFVPSSSKDSKVVADVNKFLSTSNNFQRWQNIAYQIRSGGSRAFCTGNLSIALSELGAVYSANASGATTLLTQIPTAGALIGAPAKEIWVLYKVMPVAGILSMMLSLGGNIVPMDVTDYEQMDAFSYSGMIATADQKTNRVAIKPTGETEAEYFSSRVHIRAQSSFDHMYH